MNLPAKPADSLVTPTALFASALAVPEISINHSFTFTEEEKIVIILYSKGVVLLTNTGSTEVESEIKKISLCFLLIR